MNVRRLSIGCVLAGLLIALIGAAAAGGSSRVRIWHGIRIEPLSAPVASAASSPTGPGSLTCPRPGATQSTTGTTTTAGGTTTVTAPQPPTDQTLSDEHTFSSWANVAHLQPIYSQPSTSSRRVTRLHWQTEDGFSEVYLLLNAHCDAQGNLWVHLRIPGRPNGRTGWVHRAALGRFHLTHELLVVNRARERMYVYNSGKLRWSAPVGIGKASTPTPAGHFWIREGFKILDRTSGYWPYAFGTADYSTLSDWPGGGVVGIHGPYYAPQSIPGRPSHGCIRLHTGDDAWLARHIGVGTPLQVI